MMKDETDIVTAFFLGQAIRECNERGMAKPHLIAALSPNGSILVVRVTEDGEVETLAEHYEAHGFRLPMTCLLLDQNNVAVRVVISREGTLTYE